MGVSEKWVERRLRELVEKKGGQCLKWVSSIRGVPDRIVIMPQNRIYFVETKSEGKTLDPLQRVVHRMLKKLGCDVSVIDSKETLTEFISRI